MKKAVYTGSFDPITLGHLNIVQRSSRIVEELIVGIGVNIEKKGLFEPEETSGPRQAMYDGSGKRDHRVLSGLGGRFCRKLWCQCHDSWGPATYGHCCRIHNDPWQIVG